MAKDTFEAAVETAWAHFERTLTARLATMELDDIVFVMPTENTGLRFALRFGRRRHGSLHATIACETTGLDDLIRTSGWRKRTDGRLTCERHQGPAALAEIAAQTLREVWNVPDPSFICDVGRPRPDRAPVIDPENLGPDRFRLLIRDELATFCGGSFPIRSDATIALPTAHFTSSIGISLDAPCIDIFGHLESDVRRPRFTQAYSTISRVTTPPSSSSSTEPTFGLFDASTPAASDATICSRGSTSGSTSSTTGCPDSTTGFTRPHGYRPFDGVGPPVTGSSTCSRGSSTTVTDARGLRPTLNVTVQFSPQEEP